MLNPVFKVLSTASGKPTGGFSSDPGDTVGATAWFL